MICALCGRETPKAYLEKHHLLPVHKGGKGTEKVEVCVNCGDQLHLLFSNTELKSYNTIEKLRQLPQVQRWIRWVRKKKDFSVCMKVKK